MYLHVLSPALSCGGASLPLHIWRWLSAAESTAVQGSGAPVGAVAVIVIPSPSCAVLTDLGYMSRKIRKFRTDKFDT